MVYFGGFFAKLEFSRGFLYISLFAVRISEPAMGGAGDIILIKKNETKIVRRYDRTGIYMNLRPNGSKKGRRRRRRRIAPTRRI